MPHGASRHASSQPASMPRGMPTKCARTGLAVEEHVNHHVPGGGRRHGAAHLRGGGAGAGTRSERWAQQWGSGHASAPGPRCTWQPQQQGAQRPHSSPTAPHCTQPLPASAPTTTAAPHLQHHAGQQVVEHADGVLALVVGGDGDIHALRGGGGRRVERQHQLGSSSSNGGGVSGAVPARVVVQLEGQLRCLLPAAAACVLHKASGAPPPAARPSAAWTDTLPDCFLPQLQLPAPEAAAAAPRNSPPPQRQLPPSSAAAAPRPPAPRRSRSPAPAGLALCCSNAITPAAAAAAVAAALPPRPAAAYAGIVCLSPSHPTVPPAPHPRSPPP